jgi:hypothetical protein
MGLLTFGLNVTLDGCYDHREMIADDELHDYFTRTSRRWTAFRASPRAA